MKINIDLTGRFYFHLYILVVVILSLINTPLFCKILIDAVTGFSDSFYTEHLFLQRILQIIEIGLLTFMVMFLIATVSCMFGFITGALIQNTGYSKKSIKLICGSILVLNIAYILYHLWYEYPPNSKLSTCLDIWFSIQVLSSILITKFYYILPNKPSQNL